MSFRRRSSAAGSGSSSGSSGGGGGKGVSNGPTPPIHHGVPSNGPPIIGFPQSSNQYPISNQQQQQQLQTMQMVETKYLVTRPGPMGSHGQTTAAATFFAKANQGCGRCSVT